MQEQTQLTGIFYSSKLASSASCNQFRLAFEESLPELIHQMKEDVVVDRAEALIKQREITNLTASKLILTTHCAGARPSLWSRRKNKTPTEAAVMISRISCLVSRIYVSKGEIDYTI